MKIPLLNQHFFKRLIFEEEVPIITTDVRERPLSLARIH